MLNSIFRTRQHTPVAFRTRQVSATIQNMTQAQLAEKLQSGETPFILDVRFPEEYAHDGHIAGSRLLPLPHLGRRAGELPKDKPIVCVCRSGNRSMVACEQLARLGFTELYNLDGGVIGWRRLGLPTQ